MSGKQTMQQGQSVVRKILDFDHQRKHKLVDIYDDILRLVGDLRGENHLLEELTTEFGDFQNEIPNSKAILLEAECPIVIAGETSAGKSGFINLLIGSDILPVSTLACTSTIIKIHNTTNRKIIVTNSNGSKTEIEFKTDDDYDTIRKEVKKYVSLRGEVLNCICVDMYLPLPMLKGNTVIVDTPGIGSMDHPELTARLFEFLPRAVAFIYIINASQAGGLEKDRLLAIFEEQRKWKQRGKLIEFDASRTIFVCNKWDAVEDEEEDVWDYIRKKLKEHWPNFQETQLFKLSVKEEKKMTKDGKCSENYRKLLSGIGKLVPSSLEAKVIMNARWQKEFLTNMIDKTFQRIKLSRKSQSELKEFRNTAEQRLLVLGKKISEVQKDVIEYTEDRCRMLAKRLHLHLKDPETNNRMFQWSLDQLDFPVQSFVGTKCLGIERIRSNIEKEVNAFWQREEVGKLSSDFENFLLEQLLSFNVESKEVKKLMCNHRVHVSASNDDLTGFGLLGTLASGAFSIITAPIWIPFYLVEITSHFISDKSMKSFSPEDIEKLKEFKSKPLVFMVKWCDEILQQEFSKEKIYQRLECEYIQSFSQKVRHVCENIIPQQIKADNLFIENVTNDIRSYQIIKKKYLPFGKQAKVIMGKLLIMYMEYFSHQAVATGNLRKCSRNQKWEGRFSHVHEMEMLRGKTWVKTVVKTMKQSLNTDSSFIQLAEVDFIRTINHPKIVQIYGTSIGIDDAGKKYLKLYMEHCQDSLENLVLKNIHFVPCSKITNWNMSEAKEAKEFYIRIMSGVLAGLAHLHEEGFVHRDLKMSNIFVHNGESKIADAGLNGHTYTASGRYIPRTIAPEVFSDEYFDDVESDIYSIGILMWEVYYCRPAFTSISHNKKASNVKQEEEFTFEFKDLKEFIGKIKVGLRPSFEDCRPVPELVDLIKRCWSDDTVKRPTANIVLRELEMLVNDNSLKIEIRH